MKKLNQLILIITTICSLTTFAQTWSAKLSLPSTARNAAPGFAIGNIGYIVGGETGPVNLTDFWAYNSVSDTWSAKPSFPGTPKVKAVAFSINGIGYYGLGNDSTFYKFNPTTNIWTQLATPHFGLSYWSSMYFTIGTDAYFLFASTNIFAKYNTITNTWSTLANFPGPLRFTGSGFSISGKGYITCGVTSFGSPYLNDLWEYNPTSNTWAVKAPLPATGRYATIAYSMNGQGYLLGGERFSPNVPLSEFWRYNPLTNSWTALPSFIAGARNYLSGFVICNNIYAGFGGFGYHNDFYLYGSNTVTVSTTATTICAGKTATLTASGATTYTWMPGSIVSASAIVSPTTSTTYTVTSENVIGCVNSKTISVTVNPSPTLNVLGSSSGVCIGGSAILSASGATSYTWSPGGLTTGTITVTPSATTVYTVTGLSGTCTKTQTLNLYVSAIPSISVVASSNTICAGSNVALYASGASTYTWNPGSVFGATVLAIPLVSFNYTVTGNNGLGCIGTKTLNMTVNPKPNVTAASSATTICSGDTPTLTVSGANSYTWTSGAIAGISTATAVCGINPSLCSGPPTQLFNAGPFVSNSTTSYPTPFSGWWYSAKHQFLVKVSDLNAAGITAGKISSLAFNITALNSSPLIYPDYTIKMGCTSLNALPSGPGQPFITGLTTVYNNPSQPISLGWLTHNFSQSYVWDGTSNIIIEVCTGGLTTFPANASIELKQMPYIANMKSASSSSGVSSCPDLVTNPTGGYMPNGANMLPNMRFGYCGTLLSATVSPTTTTTYTVTGVNGSGCTNTKTLSITVNPKPIVNAVSTASAICVGSTAILTASGATSYTWMPGNIVGANATVSPTTSITYTVTGTNASGCTNTKTLSLIVNPKPIVNAVSTASAICVGNTVILTASGATSFTWMPGNIVGANAVVSPTITNTYTVTGINASGCINTKTLSLTINPKPNVNAVSTASAICVGNSVILTASGATSYTWMPGSTVGVNAVVSPTITNTYTVTGINASGCINTKTINITVNPKPIITVASTATLICVGNSVSISATGATSYTWMPGAMYSASAIVAPSTSATYTVSGVNSNGCINTKTLTITVNTCTGINENEYTYSFIIFPNPVKTELNIDTDINYSSLLIVNSLGQVLMKDEKTNILHIENLSQGIYFIQLLDKNHEVMMSKKFIKD